MSASAFSALSADGRFPRHKKMGRGFLEEVYPECLAIEFHRRSIPFNREVRLPVRYDSILLPVHFKVDFICFDEVLVEIKALVISQGFGVRHRASRGVAAAPTLPPSA